jgi:hypothetical protein
METIIVSSIGSAVRPSTCLKIFGSHREVFSLTHQMPQRVGSAASLEAHLIYVKTVELLHVSLVLAEW